MLHTYIGVRAVEPRVADTYSSSDMAKIYGFPTPGSAKVVVGVISLGGGLFGSVNSNGVLTNGDVQNYWLSQGISAENHPTVVIVSVDGAVNTPSNNDDSSTLENTIDVETVGSCCPTANLTIIMYIAPNSFQGFYNVFNYAFNTPVVVKGVSVKPTIVSCSWGLAELYATSSLLTNLNNLFNTASQRGINVCTAAGDNGSSDGASGVNVDFPASSPYVVACGGTRLVCPNKIYDLSTVETVWNNNPSTSATGGGVSKAFNSPSYQSALGLAKRALPDIALNADPQTGVRFLMNGGYTTVGGTSIAAPAFAAYLACSNITTFVNPLLYSYPRSCFHDIVNGNNGAYSAGVGYDKCSGLGSINGSVLTPNLTQNVVVATSVSISPSSLSSTSQTPIPLTTTILPANTTVKTVTWKSNNTAVATVNSVGVVTPVSTGSTTITATTVNGKTASIPISVSITVRASSMTSSVLLTSTTPIRLAASVLPTTATNSRITWSSSNTAVATVTSSGVVTARSNGTATITSTTQDNSLSSSINVSVSLPSRVRNRTDTPVPASKNILQGFAERNRRF